MRDIDVEAVSKVLLARYRLALARMPELRGREPWYAREARRIRALAREIGVGEELALDVAAVLSPSVSWEELVSFLPRFLRLRGRCSFPGYGQNVRKARAMLQGRTVSRSGAGRMIPARPAGLKVERFARNLRGDPGCVTVDRWTARAAGLPERGGVRWYRLLEEAYARAAEVTGLSPSVFQAVVWEAIRSGIVSWTARARQTAQDAPGSTIALRDGSEVNGA